MTRHLFHKEETVLKMMIKVSRREKQKLNKKKEQYTSTGGKLQCTEHARSVGQEEARMFKESHCAKGDKCM